MEQRDLLSNDLIINENTQVNLTAAAKWGRFLAIAGFVGCVLMLLGGIYMVAIMPSFASSYEMNGVRIIGITYIITALILFFPCLYLNRFSTKSQEAMRSASQESLDAAFINLKSMFKFYGIVTIVCLVFLALAFLGGLSTAFLN
jgi:hypothetical protein